MAEKESSRRSLLVTAASAGAGWMLAGCATTSTGSTHAPEESGEKKEEEEVSPAEDLMREHGVLRRVLLIYEEGLRRLAGGEKVPPQTLAGGAQIIRRFIEDYHEKLEEQFLFPRFERAGKLLDLVGVLRDQHAKGRQLTAEVLRLATPESLSSPDSVASLTRTLQLFIRMYRPHAAREDTVLFPALRQVVSSHEYDALGEDFERKEHELFGVAGFEGVVEEVATLEKALGIYELSSFTPQ
ncbi:hemerythrin domain-containing protein [Cystobacter fuscus]|uniref:hemerythrin domain-containing protein n=1 Tax=Cystobacter fuscus TaxID=43 RepID=UPI002B28884D|nr:hemerythrin domain-containing protein [Cystobacter fuscus]